MIEPLPTTRTPTHRFIQRVMILAGLLLSAEAHAACTSPAGNEGEQIFDSTSKLMVFCDGTNWVSMVGGSAIGSTDPRIGSITANKWCVSTAGGTGLDCTTNAPVLTEADPKIGTLTNTKWCTTNGSTITCTTDAPVIAPAGSDGQLQFNNSGVFGGADLYYTAATRSLGVGAAGMAASITVPGGEVQVGTSGASCSSASNAGAIRYSAGTLYYCNNTNAWTPLSAGGLSGSGSANHVAYWSNASNLTYDSSQLYWDDANDRLGIGNGGPTAPLTVGTTSSGGSVYLGATDGTNEGSQIDWEGGGTYDSWATDLYQNTFRIFTNTANTDQVQIFNNSTGTAGLYVEGNVGIGTTGPNAKLDVNGTVSATTLLAAPPMMIVEDQKAASTHGGTSVASWTARTLNTVVLNTIPGASLASNQITLPAGTYLVEAWSPAYATAYVKARFYNVTDGATAAIGVNSYTNPTYNSYVIVPVVGQVSIAASKVFELQMRVSTALASYGLGIGVNMGEVEVYSRAKITQLRTY